MNRMTRLACTRSTYIVLLIAAVAFFFIGNLGGKQGNPAWLLTPVCIILMIVLGIIAFVQTRRARSESRQADPGAGALADRGTGRGRR